MVFCGCSAANDGLDACLCSSEDEAEDPGESEARGMVDTGINEDDAGGVGKDRKGANNLSTFQTRQKTPQCCTKIPETFNGCMQE